MSEHLPTGWAAARLEDVVTKQKGKKPAVLRGSAASGFVPYLDIHAIEKGVIREFAEATSSKLACADDIFVVWDGARSGWVGGKITGAIGSTIMALTPRQVSSDYLRHYLAGQFQNLNTNTRGTGIPHVDPEVFWNLEVPLAPLAEQRRIVAKLEEVLGKVERSQQRLAKVPVLLKRFRQSVLAAACSGRLTADWREENPTADAADLIATVRAKRPPKFQDASLREDLDLPETPRSWQWTNLRFLVSPDEAFCYGVVQPGENDPRGVYLIRAGDLSAGRIDTSALRRISQHIHDEYRRSQVRGGEILVTVVGAGIGETAIVQPECAGFNIARAVAKLPVREFEARYVRLWMTSNRAVNWMKGDSREVARPTLNIEQLQTLPVPVPPLAEQQEIVRRVEQLFALADRIEARFQQAKAQVDQLTPTLLAKAFRGQLVPQDPADEPASVLLERIRTAREQPVDHRSIAAARPPLDPPRYFIQLIPALLRAVQRPLALDQLNAAVALLFLPDQLLPLVAVTSGRAARAHFESFSQTNPPGAFLTAIQFLARAGTLKPVETDTGVILRLNPAKAPPIAPPVETDARHLAAIIDLVPATAVKAKLKELQPRQVREALLEM